MSHRLENSIYRRIARLFRSVSDRRLPEYAGRRAIVAIACVGGRILWYLKRLEARQEPKDTVADAPADTAAADTTPEGSGTEG